MSKENVEIGHTDQIRGRRSWLLAIRASHIFGRHDECVLSGELCLRLSLLLKFGPKGLSQSQNSLADSPRKEQ
jgi:hypothetical protein